MPEASPMLISLSWFGAAEVRRHGQPWFARLAAPADADGVEVRGELLVDAEAELPTLAEVTARLQCVCSSPKGLWSETGMFGPAALERGLRAAMMLGASCRKMPWAIESPLAGDDLLAAARHELGQLRGIARSLA